ncbi:MAG: Flp family type IVb pilin [Parvularcula sp.]
MMSAERIGLLLQRFRRETTAATAIEYGLIVGILAAGMIVLMGTTGDRIAAVFNFILTDFEAGVPAGSSSGS